MLTGNDLLAKVRELGDAGKSEIVRECGYVSTKKDGGERLNFTAFYEALLDAKGVEIGGGSVGKGGRKLSYVATVQGNGNLLIGHAYTRQLGLEPGQEFRIELQRDSGAIWLHQLGDDPSESDQDQPCSDNHSDEMSSDA